MADITEFCGDYFWLSNFYAVGVRYDGVKYPSVEHAYQAAKTLDNEERRSIKRCKRAGDAKHLGKHVKLRPGWEKTKLGIMLGLLRQKFSNLDLRTRLEATCSARLVEANGWGDVYWGVSGGTGLNWLGKLLMHVREEIKEGKQLAL